MYVTCIINTLITALRSMVGRGSISQDLTGDDVIIHATSAVVAVSF